MNPSYIKFSIMKTINSMQRDPAPYVKNADSAFPHVLSSLNSIFPFKKKFHGIHLLTCDGSDVNIPPKPGDTETYVASNTSGVGYHQMHLNAIYDLMEERYLDVVIQKRAEIKELLLKYLTDIRPGRKFPRKVRSKRFEALTNRT